jgi:hypothetical protein
VGINLVTGDTHGEIDINRLSVKNWPEQKELTKDDVVITLGDWGFIWEHDFCKTEQWWHRWLCGKRYTQCFIDGNHENFTCLKMFPIINKWGGKVRAVQIYDCVVYWLLRGEVYNINGQTILTIGGADSHDKNLRTAYIDWWPDEQIQDYDVDNAIYNLKKVNNKVDYVLSHTMPLNDAIFMSIKTKLGDSILGDNLTSMKQLERIKDIVQYKEWHLGHFHCDIHFDKYRIHYRNEPYQLV